VKLRGISIPHRTNVVYQSTEVFDRIRVTALSSKKLAALIIFSRLMSLDWKRDNI